MKKIFLALTGSIACIKAFEIIKTFQSHDFEMQIILSTGGEAFSSRVALESMTGFPVLGPDVFSFPKTEEYKNPFQKNTSEIFAHLELSQNSEALVVAPCSANFLEKMASGRADDFLSTAILAYTKPVFLVPAMNTKMWENSAVQNNIQKILTHSHSGSQQKVEIIQPEISGILACGEEGAGKMASSEDIFLTVQRGIFPENYRILSDKKILINLGGTQEKLDPVRYLGNFSTGKTGKIFAEKCFEMGASQVSVVQGNSSVKISEKLFLLSKVSSTQEMLEAMEEKFLESDVVIFSAAVADFVPEKYSPEKIKKENSGDGRMVSASTLEGGNSHGCSLQISVKENIDIAKHFAQKKRPDQIFIGFALETGDQKFLENSLQKKAKAKKFDVIIGNSPENFGTENGKFLVYFQKTQKFLEISGKKSEAFEKILSVIARSDSDVAISSFV